MGKKAAQKDRAYLTAKEWKEEWGGFKEKRTLGMERLPFHCCALSFTPFEDPVCAPDGTVFDISNIVPYLNKHHTSPVTGEPLDLEQLIPLIFHKNGEGELECPVMKKVFNQFSHIVAIKTSGNVFSYEAVQQFNVKLKSWRDLMTDDAFTKEDIIHIQRPNTQRATSDFDHVQRELKGIDEDTSVIRNSNHTLDKVLAQQGKPGSGPQPTSRRELAVAQLEAALRKKRLAKSNTASHHTATKGKQAAPEAVEVEDEKLDWRMQGPAVKKATPVFKPGTSTWDTDDAFEAKRKAPKLGDDEKQKPLPQRKGVKPADWWLQEYKPVYEVTDQTVGHAARAFTSTVAPVHTKNERVMKLKHRSPKDKAYLTLNTTMGSLNIELRCDLAPRTCENFLALCEMGYYTGTSFHRSIRNFMIQGGDPTGTGRGGESIYGPSFKDEMDSRLTHSGRGILGMANSGKDTNASQFFILYKSARHLDFKHTVFGSVVGGLELLTALEAVDTDEDDKPQKRIEITGCAIHKNPYRALMEEEAAAQVDAAPENVVKGKWFSNPKPDVIKAIEQQPEKPDNGSLPMIGSNLPPPKDMGDKSKKKRKEPEADGFDAW